MDELIKILTEMHPEIDFFNHNELIEQCILDSFDIVALVAEINDVFDVRIPPLEIIPENFNSAAALYELIIKLRGE
ncbi:MAG: phosphopantetheine-binding protein [Defluviitaleaceae bacterium]|nr:phosphopantetheine-binding protein [Defluviitaleaceae bacterium]